MTENLTAYPITFINSKAKPKLANKTHSHLITSGQALVLPGQLVPGIQGMLNILNLHQRLNWYYL
jgi:hypothetical protein